jgi:predicted nucleic acid-binding protein
VAEAVFLDTNVLVYGWDHSEPHKQAVAQQILASEDLALFVSTQVLLEFYNVCTSRLATPLDRGDARRQVAHLAALGVVNADAGLVLSAIDLADIHRLSIWDAMIVRAAQIAGCSRLLTEDLSDGERYGEVTVVNPFAGVS